jgi:hypothetical protein
MPTQASGQIIPEAPALQVPGRQDIQGSALQAAAAKTQAANAQLAAASKAMGAGQKGGAAPLNLNASIPKIPEGGTIKGVSHADIHLKNVDNLNQLRANAIGDKLGNAQPFDPTPTKGGRRTKRSRKVNGRSSKRTHRRRNRKSSSRGGRRRSSLLRHVAKRK